MHNPCYTDIERLTGAELHAELDRLAWDRAGISADEFLRRWRAGELDDSEPKIARLAVLARLCDSPTGRSNSAPKTDD